MVAGIVGYALDLALEIARYFAFSQATLCMPFQIPYFNVIFPFLNYLELTLIDLAMIVYVKKMNGRFYGVFVLGWALAIGTVIAPPSLIFLASDILFFISYLISVFEGISLWTSREQCKKPIFTAALAVITALGPPVIVLFIYSTIGPFINSLPPESYMTVIYSIGLVYSLFVDICFLLLLYLEIRKPSFAERWDMQRSTISPQR